MTTNRLSLDAARNLVAYCDSYSRMPTLLSLITRGIDYEDWRIDYEDWLQLLGEEWESCDNIGHHRPLLRILLGTRGPLVRMMAPAELGAYAQLPERITIYRGCGKRNMVGASWSLDRQVAARFPFLHRYRVPDPMIVTATVSRRNVLALKAGRGEQEIITFSARRLSVEPLCGGALVQDAAFGGSTEMA